ncbi:MAG: sigma factor-like helix-turn-helix DNA-binding protein [Acidimicrobiales bacterium]
MDLEGFEEWYRVEHARLLGALRVRCGDERLAREGVDEAFGRALERWDRVRAMDHPAGWVYRVALNDVRRSARRLVLEAALLRRTRRAEPLEPGCDVELWSAVRRLPARQKDVIVLRYVADLAEADIAAVLGITRGAVSASTAKARAALAAALGDERAEVRL